METIAVIIVVLAALWMFSGGDADDAPDVQVVPDPTPELPENAKVMLDGRCIGQITPNEKQGGWSASNSDRAMHGISSERNAIAALVKAHYEG